MLVKNCSEGIMRHCRFQFYRQCEAERHHHLWRRWRLSSSWDTTVSVPAAFIWGGGLCRGTLGQSSISFACIPSLTLYWFILGTRTFPRCPSTTLAENQNRPSDSTGTLWLSWSTQQSKSTKVFFFHYDLNIPSTPGFLLPVLQSARPVPDVKFNQTASGTDQADDAVMRLFMTDCSFILARFYTAWLHVTPFCKKNWGRWFAHHDAVKLNPCALVKGALKTSFFLSVALSESRLVSRSCVCTTRHSSGCLTPLMAFKKSL